jgi:hypothetical protein
MPRIRGWGRELPCWKLPTVARHIVAMSWARCEWGGLSECKQYHCVYTEKDESSLRRGYGNAVTALGSHGPKPLSWRSARLMGAQRDGQLQTRLGILSSTFPKIRDRLDSNLRPSWRRSSDYLHIQRKYFIFPLVHSIITSIAQHDSSFKPDQRESVSI